MTDWMARAQAEFADVGHPPTARTDETPLSTVLTVPPGADPELEKCLSTVSSVGAWATFENRILALDLIAAAMKVCDRYGDSEAAREDMRQQCLELPPHLQADLLEHFTGRHPEELQSGAPDPDAAPSPVLPNDPERPLP